jgi:hypothetical protein
MYYTWDTYVHCKRTGGILCTHCTYIWDTYTPPPAPPPPNTHTHTHNSTTPWGLSGGGGFRRHRGRGGGGQSANGGFPMVRFFPVHIWKKKIEIRFLIYMWMGTKAALAIFFVLTCKLLIKIFGSHQLGAFPIVGVWWGGRAGGGGYRRAPSSLGAFPLGAFPIMGVW